MQVPTMRTIGILMLIFVFGTSVSVSSETPCQYSKDSKGYLLASCQYNTLQWVPENLMTDIQVLDLGVNYIGTLTNDTFAPYPNLKKLRLPFNQVHTIEPGALADLAELETLDLSNNALKEVPAGLPKSLQKLNLNGNPVAVDMRRLSSAVGLQTLSLRSASRDMGHGLDGYPEFGLLPNLVDLDVSLNRRIVDVTPAQLAGTCRLARLNVTGTGLFPAGSYCRCRRFLGWTAEYKIAVAGLDSCPDATDGGQGDDDPNNENCTRTPESARVAFRACMNVWDHRNTPYWAIATGLLVAVAVVWLLLCVCVRRRRNRRRRGDNNKPQAVPATDCTKDNDNQTAAVTDKTAEPGALLSST